LDRETLHLGANGWPIERAQPDLHRPPLLILCFVAFAIVAWNAWPMTTPRLNSRVRGLPRRYFTTVAQFLVFVTTGLQKRFFFPRPRGSPTSKDMADGGLFPNFFP